jgi:hypothetical protein
MKLASAEMACASPALLRHVQAMHCPGGCKAVTQTVKQRHKRQLLSSCALASHGLDNLHMVAGGAWSGLCDARDAVSSLCSTLEGTHHDQTAALTTRLSNRAQGVAWAYLGLSPSL